MTREERCISRGSPTSLPQEGWACVPNFGGSIYAYTLCHRTTKFDVVTRGEGCVSWGQPRLPSQVSGVSVLYNFMILLYFSYIL